MGDLKIGLGPLGLLTSFAFWLSDCDYSFDAEFLKLLVAIDLFIMNMGI